MAPRSERRRAGNVGRILVLLALGFGIFFVLGEIAARSLNLVDRLNNFPRQLYEATDDEDLAYVLRPSLDTIARGERVVIDEHRMRVAPDAPPADESARTILLLGDSVAFGYRLPFEDTLGHRLERELERRTGLPHRVRNGAVEGYNTANQLAWLRRYGLRHDPASLIVVFNLNDYDYGPVMGANGVLTTDRSERVSTWSLANLSDFYVLLRWLGKIGVQALAPAPSGAPPDVATGEGQRFDKFDRFVSILRKRYYDEPTDERWAQMVAALRGLRDEAHQQGIPLLIAILPDGDQVGVDAPDLTPQKRLAEVCEEERLDCLDLWPHFEAGTGDLFLDIMHPNAKGHRIVAEALADRLTEEGS